MNYEFLKVKYEPKPSLLRERLRKKQQQSKFEIVQVSKVSCALSVMIYVFAMRRMQFSFRRTVSYSGSYALKYAYCLFRIKLKYISVGYCFLIPCVLNDSLISVALYNFCRRIHRRLCVINYINVVCTCNLNHTSANMVNTI